MFKNRRITKGFLVDTKTGESLTFQYNPDRIDDRRAPIYAKVDVPGVSHPKSQFIGGGAREISFILSFYFPERDKAGVKRRINWLQSLTYPTHDPSYIFEASPSTVLFNFGELYKNLPCKVVSVHASQFYLFDPTSLLPLRADVQVVLEEVLIHESISADKVRKGEYRSDFTL